MGVTFVPISLSPQSFFTLPSEYTDYHLKETLLLVKEGNFSWSDLMMMPVWERRYYRDQLIELSKEAKEKQEKRGRKS